MRIFGVLTTTIKEIKQMEEYDVKLTNDEMIICDRLRRMKLSTMADTLDAVFKDPLTPNREFFEIISDLVNTEWDTRRDKKFKKLLAKSGIKYQDAVFDDKLYLSERKIDQQLISKLMTCEWIKQGKTVIITGKTGTGKSYLASAFGLCALHKDYKVRYESANNLLKKLSKANEDSSEFLDYTDELISYDLLIIDDYGLMELDVIKCQLLFSLLDAREGKKATLITSQIPVKDWYGMFADSTYADACMERMSKGSYRLPLDGPSLRPDHL